ncbi:SLAP domain-containing protein [Lacticaseibacillus zhaodongensis]|uniref:SLAP domain-containing protein n=1 Tax=Lacticaseibacillus zhaodongensis TaxID=2668065 RepID=UPI0012D3019E|nr:SLAP domain-containing protein [Lacticaseibacillus zhaodongensis]
MKKKTALTLAATVGAAAAVTPAILADNGQQTAAATNSSSAAQTGTIKIIAADGAQVFDSTGAGIAHNLKQVGTILPVYGTIKFGDQSAYSIGSDQYILASEVQFTATQTSSKTVPLKNSNTTTGPTIKAASGTIQISANSAATVYDASGNTTAKTLPADSKWKYFGTTTIGGTEFYSVGGNQFVAIDMAAVLAPTSASTTTTPSTDTSTPAAATNPTTTSKPVPSSPASGTPAIGQVKITTATATLLKKDGKSVVFNADGSVKRVTLGTTWKVFDVLRIGSGTYYDLGGGQYVGASHAQYSTAVAAKTVSKPAGATETSKAPAKSPSVKATTSSKAVTSTANVIGSVSITSPTATLLKSDGRSVVYNANGTVKTVKQGSSWKVFAVRHVNGGIFYDLGGGQYVGASHVHYTASTVKKVAPVTTVFIAHATINYVPGFGIQVWHADSSMVTKADGTPKKLMHGSHWKVFNRLVKDGHVYYGLGGDQYIDSSYVILN